MINHLRQRVAALLAAAQTAILSTSGPAGLHAQSFPCQAHGLLLYLLVPATSDHLLNLEEREDVLVNTSRWQLRGRGRILPLDKGPDVLLLSQQPNAIGCVLLEVYPLQLQVQRLREWGFSETIDIEYDAPQDLKPSR